MSECGLHRKEMQRKGGSDPSSRSIWRIPLFALPPLKILIFPLASPNVPGFVFLFTHSKRFCEIIKQSQRFIIAFLLQKTRIFLTVVFILGGRILIIIFTPNSCYTSLYMHWRSDGILFFASMPNYKISHESKTCFICVIILLKSLFLRINMCGHFRSIFLCAH